MVTLLIGDIEFLGKKNIVIKEIEEIRHHATPETAREYGNMSLRPFFAIEAAIGSITFKNPADLQTLMNKTVHPSMKFVVEIGGYWESDYPGGFVATLDIESLLLEIENDGKKRSKTAKRLLATCAEMLPKGKDHWLECAESACFAKIKGGETISDYDLSEFQSRNESLCKYAQICEFALKTIHDWAGE